ncbi:MAG: 50S ribosomal protein L35 [Cytophagales bacterium]
MPKIKSHSGSSKRFKITGTGKVKRKHAFKNHNLYKKSKKAKRKTSSMSVVNNFDKKEVLKILNI